MTKTHFSHPGAILKRMFLEEMNIRPGTLARAIGVPRTRIKAIIEEERDITADTALRLSRFFGNSEQFWMNLQSHYNLEVAKQAASTELARIRRHDAAGDHDAASV